MNFRISILFLSLSMTSCNFLGTPSVSEMREFIDNEKSKKSYDIDPIPPLTEYSFFHYQSSSISPFQPQLSNAMRMQSNLRELDSKEENRQKEELENYDLSEMTPLGIISDKRGSYALLSINSQDLNNDKKCIINGKEFISNSKDLECSYKSTGSKIIKNAGTLRTVKIGSRIGKNFGEITHINARDNIITISQKFLVTLKAYREEEVNICWPSRLDEKPDTCYNINSIKER